MSRQRIDKAHQICEHGRNAFTDDCGMCDLAGTDWATGPAEPAGGTDAEWIAAYNRNRSKPDGFLSLAEAMRDKARQLERELGEAADAFATMVLALTERAENAEREVAERQKFLESEVDCRMEAEREVVRAQSQAREAMTTAENRLKQNYILETEVAGLREENNRWLARSMLLEPEIAVLRAALERLGSMEAFVQARSISERDDELIARIKFAESAALKEPKND